MVPLRNMPSLDCMVMQDPRLILPFLYRHWLVLPNSGYFYSRDPATKRAWHHRCDKAHVSVWLPLLQRV